MTTVFIAYPGGSGGNHLKNLLKVGSNFVNHVPDNQDIIDVYTTKKMPMVHVAPFSNDIFKTTRSDSEQNIIYYGHFIDIYSSYKEIASVADKKFILLSIETDESKKIWMERCERMFFPYYRFNKPSMADNYFIKEQTYLYQSDIYYDLFHIEKSDLMEIAVSEWFSEDILPVLNRLENFLQITIDKELCSQLHNTWYGFNQPKLT